MIDPTGREPDLSQAEWDPMHEAHVESEETPGRGSVCGGPQQRLKQKSPAASQRRHFLQVGEAGDCRLPKNPHKHPLGDLVHLDLCHQGRH